MMSVSLDRTFALVASASVSTVMLRRENPGWVRSIAAMSLASLTQPFSQLAFGRWANSLIPTHKACAAMVRTFRGWWVPRVGWVDRGMRVCGSAADEHGVRTGVDHVSEPRGIAGGPRRFAG